MGEVEQQMIGSDVTLKDAYKIVALHGMFLFLAKHEKVLWFDLLLMEAVIKNRKEVLK